MPLSDMGIFRFSPLGTKVSRLPGIWPDPQAVAGHPASMTKRTYDEVSLRDVVI